MNLDAEGSVWCLKIYNNISFEILTPNGLNLHRASKDDAHIIFLSYIVYLSDFFVSR